MRLALTLSLFLAGVAALSAHHTVANVYDPTRRVTLTGTISELDWKQPHVIIHLDVKAADGHFVRWDVETQAPYIMVRQGLPRDAVRPETAISTTGCLARDGSNKVYAQTIVLPDGTSVANGGCNS